MKNVIWGIVLVAILGAAGLVWMGFFAEHMVKSPGVDSPPAAAASDRGGRLLLIAENWPPFEYEQDGKIVGVDVEVLARIFKKLGIAYEIRLYPWSRCKMMAENGETDMLLSISYAKDRESFLLYTESQREFGRSGTWPTEYLWSSEYVFFCRQLYADKLKFESLAQVRADGYRLGTVRDYSYSPEFQKTCTSAYEAPDFESGIRLLAEGKYDLFPADQTVGMHTVKKLRLTSELTRLPKAIFKKPYLMPFGQKSTYPDKLGLMTRLYAELAALRESGEYQKIYDRYTQ